MSHFSQLLTISRMSGGIGLQKSNQDDKRFQGI